MAAHLTPEQARKLGITVPGSPLKARMTKRVVKDAPFHTRCVDCQEEFTVEARETEHVAETPHRRFELVLTEETS
jgi:hypothetical protein